MLVNCRLYSTSLTLKWLDLHKDKILYIIQRVQWWWIPICITGFYIFATVIYMLNL